MRPLALPALALAFAALVGCATDKRNEALNRTLMNYAGAIRWGDFTSAQSFIDKDYLAEHPISSVEQGRLQQLRVTGYDEGGGPRPDGEDDVIQIVQINVVNINTQAERSVIDRQRWHYDREKGKWTLMTGLPDFSPH
ncbi:MULTISPECIES: hypothetical protein [Luteibacter]|uniref:Uncharacterized protein n=1 Tax=Luteibacter flocculans TaxID=2780091 RepID=A0ABY4SZM6_9GAMM|nr:MULTISPECIES: hypothetical protein [Luteibacter]URL58139.1 hypothetical protein IM816_16295 [Luteibacter flocculans]SFW74154.1 hypothetical protein SAMN02800691_3393 [Luteibacter sp. UNCMF366Tsu5.1]